MEDAPIISKPHTPPSPKKRQPAFYRFLRFFFALGWLVMAGWGVLRVWMAIRQHAFLTMLHVSPPAEVMALQGALWTLVCLTGLAALLSRVRHSTRIQRICAAICLLLYWTDQLFSVNGPAQNTWFMLGLSVLLAAGLYLLTERQKKEELPHGR